ncbi:MAG: type IX secretion system sortase PorU [Ignavibacteriales bacterium]|nr:type IX secretion system sortase PorU [Ignavibacteriales bacterium]
MKTKFSLMILFFVLNLVLSAQDIKILSSDLNSIILEYHPVYGDTSAISSQGEQFFKIKLLGGFVANFAKQGLPQLQVRALNIGVPSEVGNTIQVLSSDFSILSGKYLPNPRLEKYSVGAVEKYLKGDNYSSTSEPDLVSFGEFGLVRNLPVQTINIYPIQFDGKSNTIKVYKKIIFKISFSSSRAAAQPVKDDLLQSVVLNWDVAKNWGVAEKKLQKISSSAFADGDWYRIETPGEGIYRIDRNYLQALGVDVNNVDPRKIKIFGYGGYSLPEAVSLSKSSGPIENAIYISGEQDGKFDASDYILFYGRQPEFWEYSTLLKKIIRLKQPYSKKNYYLLNISSTNGKRMTEKPSLNISNAYPQQSTFAFVSNDKDSTNIGKSGRDYLGDQFDSFTKSRTYINTLTGILPSSKINYKFRLINGGTTAVSVLVQESGTQIYNTSIRGTVDFIYGYEDSGSETATYSGTLSQERSNLKISLTSSSDAQRLYLDYFEIYYQRALNSISDNLLFFSKDTTTNIEYTLSNFSNSTIQAFDVTDYANVKIISGAAISGGQLKFEASEIKGNVSKYLSVGQSGFKVPVNGIKITNSNLRGNLAGSEMIIIAPRDFKTQAEKYASYRSSQSPYKLSTQIFYVDDIMNEFSGGVLDPTAIRDFVKFAYDNWQIKPSYLLLFGDGDYDYLNSEKLNVNFIPTYQTAESLDEISSYPMDDYFARVSGDDRKIDLAIGRMNIQTTQDADVVIAKVIKYETGLEKGIWRNTITLAADDGPAAAGQDDGSTHTAQSENLANNKIPKYFDLDKIYLAAYPTVFTGSGRRKPGVNKAIVDAVNNGTLILNWIGHGNPGVWAHESVFEKTTTIPQLVNQNYFFLTAATCDFGKYDDPSTQSSTELMNNKGDGGSIAAFTAARVVFSTSNAEINDSLYSNLFRVRDANNLPVRIGKAYFLTKQFLNYENDDKYHLFGDPALRLDEPQMKTAIDSVNGKSLKALVQLNALSPVIIKGSVRNPDGTKNLYNGEAVVSVFDSERSLELKEMNYTITLPGGLIYKGRATVTNGEFQSEFVVPKDISYENKNGKIVSYISNSSIDGVGFTNNIIVGGTNPDAKSDGKGPDIAIYFDNVNFTSSYLVNPDFTLIAKLSDQTGLNTTGTGIGHKLEGILNDDQTNAIDFSNNFVGDLNSGGKSGTINYKFTNMSPGDYKLTIKAWDVYNNLSTQDASFTVVSADNGIVLRDVVNYPNPFSSNTTFTFQHNISSAINAKIKIYSIAGRLIKQIEATDLLDKFVKIDWDGRDEDGNQIANGTYLYKLIVESVDGLFKDNVLGKLAVVR